MTWAQEEVSGMCSGRPVGQGLDELLADHVDERVDVVDRPAGGGQGRQHGHVDLPGPATSDVV